MTINLQDLAKPFPREAVSWRAQTLTKAGDKALALAYIDARDVMQRLDEVCGPDGWEDSYVETPRGRVIATIRIRINDQWVSKSDGAGDTAVEGEKGGISDAFKRAAVKWGIGRYLYDIEAPWVPCKTYESNGRRHWSEWAADPWSCIRGAASKQATPQSEATKQQSDRMNKDEAKSFYTTLQDAIRTCANLESLASMWAGWMPDIKRLPEDWELEIINLKDQRKEALSAKAAA